MGILAIRIYNIIIDNNKYNYIRNTMNKYFRVPNKTKWFDYGLICHTQTVRCWIRLW